MSKHLTLLAAGLIALGGLAGCNKAKENAQEAEEMTCIEFDKGDSLQHFELSALLPTGQDSASTAIRTELLATLQAELQTWHSADESEGGTPMGIDDVKARVEKCYDESHAALVKEKEEYDLPFYAPYEWQFKIDTLGQTDRYIVYSARGYQFTGGAHGGVIGRGCMTFDKADGHVFADWIMDECDPGFLQLVLEGIARYFSEAEEKTVAVDQLSDYLLENPDYVHMPAEAPYPSAEGLVFTYQQYEIAPYAAGMPNFTIGYEQLMPYLTDKAKALLAL